jgi:hypothetical protein
MKTLLTITLLYCAALLGARWALMNGVALDIERTVGPVLSVLHRR